MNSTPELEARLSDGLLGLGLVAEPRQRLGLLGFLDLIQKWNRLYNLTALHDGREMVDLHLLDSLTVHPYLRGGAVLDVGTGAGVPGIPLAIMNPKRHFTLLDSRAKKTRFVRQAAIELGLDNVTVVTERVEHYRPAAPFQTILVRAFASLERIVQVTRGLLAAEGVILALKGQGVVGELGSLSGCTARLQRLWIPGLNVTRYLVEITVARGG